MDKSIHNNFVKKEKILNKSYFSLIINKSDCS